MSSYNKVKPELIEFLKSLDKYNEIPFNRKIEDYGISVGFVYKELCEDFNLRLIENIEKCITQDTKVKEGKTFIGWWNMLIGKGFRDDVRTFSEEYDERARYSIDMIREELYRIMKRLEKLSQRVDAMPKPMLKSLKYKHSKYGYLNAEEWFDLAENNLALYKDLKEDLDEKLSSY
jgi:hypothetical protein